MADMMTFPDTWEEYEKLYGFNDSEEVYTNGSRLIPSFRVRQWLDYIAHLESKRESKQQATVSSDCVSRQDAIDALDVLCQEHRYKIPGKRETYSQYNEAWQDALGRAENAIGNLPSAEPDKDMIHLQKEQAYMQGYEDGRKSRKGKWIVDSEKYEAITCVCSICGRTMTTPKRDRANYCWNCGSYNGGEWDG